mmetsp:Transcript_4349/g.12176  ORF Transcript_4349/g.12176 Transcript_4349/m.12176 type:complete len:430 (+) Transcript_4349:123-1412(+)
MSDVPGGTSRTLYLFLSLLYLARVTCALATLASHTHTSSQVRALDGLPGSARPRSRSRSDMHVDVHLLAGLGRGGCLLRLLLLLPRHRRLLRRRLLPRLRLAIGRRALILPDHACHHLLHHLLHLRCGRLCGSLAHLDKVGLQLRHRDGPLAQLGGQRLLKGRGKGWLRLWVELRKQHPHLLASRVGEVDVHVNAAVADQRGVEPLAVVGGEHKELPRRAAHSVERVEQAGEGHRGLVSVLLAAPSREDGVDVLKDEDRLGWYPLHGALEAVVRHLGVRERREVAHVALEAARERLDDGGLARARRAVQQVGPLVRDAVLDVPLLGRRRRKVSDVVYQLALQLRGQHHRLHGPSLRRLGLVPILMLHVPAEDVEDVAGAGVRGGDEMVAEADERADVGVRDEHERAHERCAAIRADHLAQRVVHRKDLG